jgi:uncharacterized membrane protein YcaP (DUF421 family)
MSLVDLFAVRIPVAEILIRGTCIYWFLFVIFRFPLRRDVGSVGIADILLFVIVADAAQNALAGEYKSIGEGMILIATIAGWNLLFDWLSYRSRTIDRFLRPRALPLIRHGRPIKQNLARELMTMEDLMSKLRIQGVASVAEVRHAYLESDGEISVIKQQEAAPGQKTR